MINIDLSHCDAGIVRVKVEGKIEKGDFDKHVGPVVDELIEHQGKITGLLIDVTSFDGWTGITALLEHIRFIRHHHKYITRVAIVGNHTWQAILPRLAPLFVNATVSYFDENDHDTANLWITGEAD